MKDKVLKEIASLEYSIEDHKKRLEEAVAEFRRSASEYDAYDIVTFIPGKIRDIEYERGKIAELEEKKRMLVWLCKED